MNDRNLPKDFRDWYRYWCDYYRRLLDVDPACSRPVPQPTIAPHERDKRPDQPQHPHS